MASALAASSVLLASHWSRVLAPIVAAFGAAAAGPGQGGCCRRYALPSLLTLIDAPWPRRVPPSGPCLCGRFLLLRVVGLFLGVRLYVILGISCVTSGMMSSRIGHYI